MCARSISPPSAEHAKVKVQSRNGMRWIWLARRSQSSQSEFEGILIKVGKVVMADRQELETIGKAILDVSFDLHTQFGSGLLERAYRVLLASELRRQGHKVEEEKICDIDFRGVHYENMFRVDLLVDDNVIVELKSVSRMEPVFAKQCLTYLRFMKLRLGYVINFGMPSLKNGISRIVNNL